MLNVEYKIIFGFDIKKLYSQVEDILLYQDGKLEIT